MITMRGVVVFMEQLKSEKGRWYKRIQLQAGGMDRRVETYDVTDMANTEYVLGREYTLPVSARAFTGQRGAGINWTCWDGPVETNVPITSVGASTRAAGATPPPSSNGGNGSGVAKGL